MSTTTRQRGTVTDSYGNEHEVWGPFESMAQVKRLNRATAHHWFDRDTMAFFGSAVESNLRFGRLFVSSEQPPVEANDVLGRPRAFTVRCSTDDGRVVTVGEFMAHATLDAALDALYTAVVPTYPEGAQPCP